MIKTLVLPDTSKKVVHLGGWKKQQHDPRDFKLCSVQSVLPGAALTRPAAVDNSKWCSGVEDQGELGSCTAHMFAGIIEYNDIRWNTTVDKTRVSRLFEYFCSRKIEGTISEDSGATIRDAIKAGATYGILKESLWWYNVAKFTATPPRKYFDQAAQKKIVSYHSINDGDIETMKQALASGYLVGFGFEVYSNMMTQQMATNGWLHRPGPNDSYQGGHAVVLVGYDDAKKAFKVRNSWGTGWGLGGYFWMDYDYVSDTSLASDFWVVNSVPAI